MQKSEKAKGKAKMTPSKYVNENFVLLKKSQTNQPFGAYVGYAYGTLYYVRKDGLPFTAFDLEMLNKRSLGQVNKVIGNPGDTEVSVKFEVDSTD